MKKYQPFVNRLNKHLKSQSKLPLEVWRSESFRLLDGLAATELRRLVDIDTRRSFGAFFTNTELATTIIRDANLTFGSTVILYDPAVGAGNLLLAGWQIANETSNNIKLCGTDLHHAFVEACTIRLKINQKLSSISSESDFDVTVADGLVNNTFYSEATHILTNPPFNLIMIGLESPISWGKGKVSAAAVFIDRIIEYINPGVQVVAILPDVLRSGSRYAKWRTMVEKRCWINKLQLLGQFDKYADVDVFTLKLVKAEKEIFDQKFKWSVANASSQTIADFFDVSVGHVVDNRDQHHGPTRPFLVSRGLPGWHIVTSCNRKRSFNGRSITGPFVVIKRTSRIGDKHRAVATVININESVYVDNHLIIVRPKTGRLSDCQRLIATLATPETDDWINSQIRCRHLTVGIVKRIPYNAQI